MVIKFITKIFPAYHLSSVSNFVNKLELKKKLIYITFAIEIQSLFF